MEIRGSRNNKALFLLILFSSFTIFLLQTITADVISLNVGGNTEIAITPDKYVEGFFSGVTEGVSAAPVCGNSVVETGETCDDGNAVSGDGCSSTCIIEVVVPTGGGGGGGGGAVTPMNIIVSPAEFNVNLAIDTTVQQTISVTNLGTSNIVVGVSQQNLTSHVILGNTSLTIPAGETVTLDVVFVALSEPGIFTGKIFIGNKEVLVSLNVKTKLLFFDSNIVVLNPELKVTQGGQLKTLITLIPLGDPERLDVTLNFVIKDYTNKVYLTKSETLLVTNLTELRRTFDTGLLAPGDYVVGLQLVYPNGVAPSSAHFRIVPKTAMSFFGKIVLFLIIMILMVGIFILIILIWRRRKKKEEQPPNSKNPSPKKA